MYKLKNGGMVSRPARIGDTFIGSLTDLGPYGYYLVSLAKPQDAPTKRPPGFGRERRRRAILVPSMQAVAG